MKHITENSEILEIIDKKRVRGKPRKYNKDSYEDVMKERVKILSKMSEDDEFARIQYNLCKRDIFYWLKYFAWVHEPRNDKYVPRKGRIAFIPYPFQERFISTVVKHIEDGSDLVVEKSRDMGATWVVLMIFQWYWLFGESGNDFLLGSINAAKTDKLGMMDTLFQKLRFNLYSQPEFFMPREYNKQYHDGFMKLVNPESGNFIGGDSNTQFATSGRYKAIFFDEFAKWFPVGQDRIGWQSAGDATSCRIAVSSAYGRNNIFYELVSSRYAGIDKERLHWREHPNKSEDWYKREQRRRSKAEIAQEVDIDYLASVANRAAENWNYDRNVKSFNLDYNLPIQLHCDFNIDPMCWVVSQEIKGVRYTGKEFVEETTRTEYVIKKVLHELANWKCKEIELYGDASGKFGHTSSRYSDWEIIKRACKAAGWVVHDYVPIKNPTHIDRINALNKRLYDWETKAISEYVHPRCKNLINSIEITERNSSGIIKNGMEHFFDAFSYYTYAKERRKKQYIGQIKRV